MTYTATEYTLSQMSGKLYRVGWHKFATQRQAEEWAQQRLGAPMMAPHFIDIRRFRGKRSLCAYESDSRGGFTRRAAL